MSVFVPTRAFLNSLVFLTMSNLCAHFLLFPFCPTSSFQFLISLLKCSALFATPILSSLHNPKKFDPKKLDAMSLLFPSLPPSVNNHFNFASCVTLLRLFTNINTADKTSRFMISRHPHAISASTADVLRVLHSLHHASRSSRAKRTMSSQEGWLCWFATDLPHILRKAPFVDAQSTHTVLEEFSAGSQRVFSSLGVLNCI